MGMSSGDSQSSNQSTSTSSSLNQAYPSVSNSLTGTMDQTGKASNAIASLLGLNGPADTSGLSSFLNSSNYNFTRDQGIAGINANNASKGLLASGSALRGITDYSSNLASTYLDKYLSNLSGLAGTGISAAQTISGAGNTANSQSNSYGTSSGSNSSVQLK
jgi:hypothetical protein